MTTMLIMHAPSSSRCTMRGHVAAFSGGHTVAFVPAAAWGCPECGRCPCQGSMPDHRGSNIKSPSSFRQDLLKIAGMIVLVVHGMVHGSERTSSRSEAVDGEAW